MKDALNAQFLSLEGTHAVPMPDISKKPVGRPSKGPRHVFTIKLDLERAEKLKGILISRKITGVEYLTPIIEAHVDSVDLHRRPTPSEKAEEATA